MFSHIILIFNNEKFIHLNKCIKSNEKGSWNIYIYNCNERRNLAATLNLDDNLILSPHEATKNGQIIIKKICDKCGLYLNTELIECVNCKSKNLTYVTNLDINNPEVNNFNFNPLHLDKNNFDIISKLIHTNKDLQKIIISKTSTNFDNNFDIKSLNKYDEEIYLLSTNFYKNSTNIIRNILGSLSKNTNKCLILC